MTKNNHNIPEDYNKKIAAHKSAEKPAVLAGDTSKGKPKTSTAKRFRISKKSFTSSSILILLVALLIIGTVATYLYSQKSKNNAEVTVFKNPVFVADSPTTSEVELAKRLKTDSGVVSTINESTKTLTILSDGQQRQYTWNESTGLYLGESSELINLDSIKLNQQVTVEYDDSNKTLINVWVYNE